MEDPSKAALEDCLLMLVDSLSTELAFEMHCACKTGILSLDEIYTENNTRRSAAGFYGTPTSSLNAPGAESSGIFPEEAEELVPSEEQQQFSSGAASNGSNQTGIDCAHCSQRISVLRYAIHLDKCMSKGGPHSQSSSTSGGAYTSPRQAAAAAAAAAQQRQLGQGSNKGRIRNDRPRKHRKAATPPNPTGSA